MGEAVRLTRASIVAALVGVLVGAGAVGVAWALTDRGHGPGAGKVVLSFEPGPAGDEQLVRRAFEPAVRKLNSELGLSNDLQVRVVGRATAARVGAQGPFYDPQDRTVYIPWDYVEEAKTILRNAGQSSNLNAPLDNVLSGAMTFVLYHETAHGMIDLLDLPVQGREETVSDSFGTTLAIASGPDGQTIALAAGELFAAHAKEPQNPAAQAAARYDLPQQRYFDVQCLVYGSNPARNANLVGAEQGMIPPGQSQTCVYDYQREARSWQRLLGPHLRNDAALSPTRS
jgi:hypothetical protein